MTRRMGAACNGKKDDGHYPNQQDIENDEEIPVSIRILPAVSNRSQVDQQHGQHKWCEYSGNHRRNFADQLRMGLDKVGRYQGSYR